MNLYRSDDFPRDKSHCLWYDSESYGKEGLFVKRIVSVLILLLLLVGCSKSASSKDLWSLGERYSLSYSRFGHVYTYTLGNDTFYLFESKSKKAADRRDSVKETLDLDGRTYTLYEAEKDADSDAVSTYFLCQTETRSYLLTNDETPLDLGALLSLSDAAQLMQHPLDPPNDIRFVSEEWNAYYRTDSCNLEIYVYPNDGGKHAVAPDDSYETREEKGETYLYSEKKLGILYTDGDNTVWIRQTNLANKEHVEYATLRECKAILAMLGK